MGSIQKNTIIILCSLVFGLWSIPVLADGAFSIATTPEELDYYPETVLTISLENLTINNSYSLLIGANQNSYDYQWDNFTATATAMDREIIHFDTQTYLDNTSQDIKTLVVALYNSSDVQISVITYHLIRTSQQLDVFFLSMIFLIFVTSIVLINILYVIVEYIFK